MRPAFTVLAGASPLVLVAPHGGRRDAARRAWEQGGLRVNDLHTASLTRELAALTGASALINATHDRNDTDLNRISDADARAPEFLAALRELLEAALARHGRATLLTVHGWNVVQPALDVGLGCAPGTDPFAVGRGAAVSPAFAAGPLRRLVAACAARGIAATVGARYPARHRENLIQLFTTRHERDPRPPVAGLAALAPRVDALQLELAIALRWPGPWRRRLLEACAATLPDLVAPGAEAAEPTELRRDPAAPALHRLQLASPTLCGLVALDAGGRLLLFPPAGGLALFTGERTGGEEPHAVGGLTLQATPGGGTRVRFRGPLLRFSDTTPFLDLEAGLARGHLVEAETALDFTPVHGHTGAGEFGAVTGVVVLDGRRITVDGHGFAEEGPPVGPWPRLRAALRLSARTALAVTVGLDDGRASGFVCRDGGHVPVVAARAALGPAAEPLARVAIEIELPGDERLVVSTEAVHRLPVIRARGVAVPLRLEYAACRLDGHATAAGWCEVAGL